MRNLIFLIFIGFSTICFAQTWVQKATLSGNPRINPAGFSIGTKGYVIFGTNGINNYNDLWEYQPSQNQWMQKASYPNNGRRGAVGCSVDTFGFAGLGWDGSSNYNDWYQYYSNQDVWLQKTSYPGSGTRNPQAGTLNGKIYILGGSDGSATFHDEFYEYDPVVDQWTSLSNHPIPTRTAGICFSIDSLIYFGLGHNGSVDYQDVWSYNPNLNIWSQIPGFPGVSRIQASVTVIDGKAIVGGGNRYGVGVALSDYYEYNPSTNSWTQITGFQNGDRTTSTSFTNGNKGYIVAGRDGNNSSGIALNDTWEVSYNTVGFDEKVSPINKTMVYPNPANNILNINLENVNYNDVLRLYSSSGKLIYNTNLKDNFKLNIEHLKSGLYLYEILQNNNKSIGKLVVE